MLKPLTPLWSGIVRILTRWIALPLYKALMLLRLRVGRLLGSARSILFFVFTNRYLFHTSVIVITLATIGYQFKVKNAAASEAGTHTLLYSLVTNGEDSLVEEEIRPELLAKNAHYLGADTIQALPDIDFDFEEELPLADLSIPGSIEATPGSTQIPTDRVIVRNTTEIYTVQEGDTIAQIARHYGLDVPTITYSNGLGKNSYIKPGDKLKIPPVSGILHVIKSGDTIDKLAQTYGVKPDPIYEANRLSRESKLVLGEELMIPGGIPVVPNTPIATNTKPPVKRPTTIKPNIPLSNIRDKNVDVYQELVNSNSDTRVKPKDVDVAEAPKTKLLWPTRGHVITQYYGWKHTGVDIDGDYTDPIYASADGIVEQAGWNDGGYGLMVLINHENGLKTRYGHGSKLFVQAGDRVKRGQVIAMVGTTGRSTGTHLHYEVYASGKRGNPLSYTK